MMNRGSARVARFTYYRHNERTTLLAGKISQGPKTEMGREIHLVVTKNDLPALRDLVARLEAS